MRSVLGPPGRSRPRRYGRLLAAGAVVLALAAAGCASSGSPSSSGNTPVKGGTAVWAEPPSEVPSYILPFMNAANESNVNLFDFQYLMYRPLYWFGQGSQPTVNNSLSLAKPPVFNGDKVTITLKNYKWSNGTQVTTQDLMFFINMLKAEPSNFYATVPGGFPANVSAVTAVSPTELTMTMNKSYSPTWFEYNELSLIVPMPAAWDRTASGSSDCATTVSDCAAVYNYLAGQAKDLNTYATSPLWGIVDGPWKLTAFNADGHDTYVPNKSYSGPVKPKLAAFQEVPFTTDSAEYDVLRSAASSTKIDVGYLPDQDAPAKPANATVGSNPLSGYTLDPLYPWGIDYYALNYNSTVSDHAAVFKQLYFRQAMAYLLNQSALITGPLRGYGAPTVGPVAATPASKWLSATGKKGNPYPYNPGKAKTLLASNGWSVNPSGTTTCTDPSKCGAGITKGTALSFNFIYESGVSWVQSEMTQLQSSAATVGIKLSLVPKPFGQVIEVAGGNCAITKSPCNWDLANWGFGWSFSPDYLPTGDELFQCGAISNSGGYCNPTNDSLIEKTLTSGSMSNMYTWQDYLAPQLPVEYQPNAAYTLTEVANNLKGYFPQSPTLSITPENWYFVK
ncbi:MAG TPA: ABC transporter substrate-binding protein [Streptosporangiaceae bacterium]|nr:ABC transporter substrate-binding protein [Streptosporangiaceae bacterium]